MTRALLLNADHTPIRTLSWQRAVTLLLDGRVLLLASREGQEVRAQHVAVPWPSVVALPRYVRVRTVPALTRRNVLARDGWCCVYCEASADELAGRPPHERLTLDHVVPRSRAHHGFVEVPWSPDPVPVHSWLNVVTACGRCNGRKGDRRPEEAGLRLPRPPFRPNTRDLFRIHTQHDVPPEWLPWLPVAA